MKTAKLNVMQLIGVILCVISLFLPALAFRMPLVRTKIMVFNFLDLLPFSSLLNVVFLLVGIALLSVFWGGGLLFLISGAGIIVTGLLFCILQGSLIISRDIDWLLQQGQGVLNMLLQATGYSLDTVSTEQMILFKEALKMLQHIEVSVYLYILSGILCCAAALFAPSSNKSAGGTSHKSGSGNTSIF